MLYLSNVCTKIANPKNLDDVMLMYKVIESSNDYEKA